MSFRPETDLQIDRLIKARPETVWRCWAEPDLFRQWFVPAPVRVTACEIALRAGGGVFSEMALPDGPMSPSHGSARRVDPRRRLVFGDALRAGFRPTGSGVMTADGPPAAQDSGTRDHALVMHATALTRRQPSTWGSRPAGPRRWRTGMRWRRGFDTRPRRRAAWGRVALSGQIPLAQGKCPRLA